MKRLSEATKHNMLILFDQLLFPWKEGTILVF